MVHPLCSTGDSARIFNNSLDRIIIDDAELSAMNLQAGA
jgi:hypothetical protein